MSGVERREREREMYKKYGVGRMGRTKLITKTNTTSYVSEYATGSPFLLTPWTRT